MKKALYLVLAMLGSAALSACASTPNNPSSAAFCERFYRSGPALCSDAPLPAPEVEQAARRFEPDAEHLTVYVLRDQPEDTAALLRLRIDGGDGHALLPHSFMRLRLSPGAHRLSIDWRGQPLSLDVSGAAGEVRFASLSSQGWWASRQFSWQQATVAPQAERVSQLRLLADL